MGKLFSFKYSLLDFSTFKEVKDFSKEYKESKMSDFEAIEKLKDIYWTRIYSSLEDAEEAFDILGDKLINPFRLLKGEELLNNIMEECKRRNKEYLYTKIINTCPNGDSVCHHYFEELKSFS